MDLQFCSEYGLKLQLLPFQTSRLFKYYLRFLLYLTVNTRRANFKATLVLYTRITIDFSENHVKP